MEKTNGRHIIGTVRCRIGFSGYRLVTTGIRGLSFITLAPPLLLLALHYPIQMPCNAIPHGELTVTNS